MLNAIARAARSDIAAYAILVDAKGEGARAFYEHHGFAAVRSAPETLFLPLAEAARRLKEQAN